MALAGRSNMEGIDKFFKLTERGSTLGTEIRAGTATFVTLCYILAGLPVCLVCCLLQRCVRCTTACCASCLPARLLSLTMRRWNQ